MKSKIAPEDLLEVTFDDEQNFLKIKETLTRIGISSKKDNTLYQSCHILHKKSKYYIVHFKEMFLLDGLSSEISENFKGDLSPLKFAEVETNGLFSLPMSFLQKSSFTNLMPILPSEF